MELVWTETYADGGVVVGPGDVEHVGVGDDVEDDGIEIMCRVLEPKPDWRFYFYTKFGTKFK